MDTFFLIIIGFYLLLCFLIASSGAKRHIGYTASFAISFLLSPVIGLIVTALSSRLPEQDNTSSWRKAADEAERLAYKDQHAAAIDKYQDAMYELEKLKLRKKPAAERDKLVRQYRLKVEELKDKLGPS